MPARASMTYRQALIAALILPAAAAFATTSAHAAKLGIPKAPFSAEMHVIVRDRAPFVVKLYNTPAKLRYEFSVRGQRRIILLDRTAKTLFILDPRRKVFVKRPYSMRADPVAQLPPKDATLEKIGPEKLGDANVVKYKVSGKTYAGRPFNGHVWLLNEEVILKIAGFVQQPTGTVKTSIELKKYKAAAPDAKLFTVPDDYKPAPKPKAPPARQ